MFYLIVMLQTLIITRGPFIIRGLAQGLVSDCISDDNVHVGDHGNSSRSICAECKVVGKRDSRTRIYCIKCKSACCKAHSFSICKNCV